MTEKKTYWVRNEAGEYALLDGAAERDRLSAFGWKDADEPPAEDTFVWMSHEGVDNPAKFPAGSVPHWLENGWTPTAPPEHVDPTKQPQPDARPAWAAALGFGAPAEPAATTKSAAAGKNEGK